ncbi:MAG TPA: sigma-54-dependent Fis family transcriptional regulator [Candidatus Aminicenantes bacterium]|nr:sigma-54-dependent Fis family transcriptional regulator [Candidatus Aminicenantes bacterium]HDT12911.1 sigma-54-dependent Fis family transcriptional regulator [Candidatus Aminicenantes bacterium]
MNEPLILVVEDDPVQRTLVREYLESRRYPVVEAASVKEAQEAALRQPVDIAIVDYKLGDGTGIEAIRGMLAANPLITPIMVTAYGNIERAVEAVRAGAYDYIVKPLDFEKFLLVLERAAERQKLRREISSLQERLDEKFSSRNFVFASPVMDDVAGLIVKAARSEATVLISGETGTGKDLVARLIHQASSRKNGPYVALNIPSLPEALIEAELFGAEKGAYTGAHERKIGKFEGASGGTILLDEIGDLAPGAQVKLLRFLQDREFYRLGSNQALRADVRVIAATNQDLEALRKDGRFRADLFYRLNVIPIVVPPLRRRREDIPPLVDLFLKKYGEREGKRIQGVSREAMAALVSHPYPGNVRELENVVERAVVFAEKDALGLADLPVDFTEAAGEGPGPSGDSLVDKVRRLEVQEIRLALRASDGIKSRAARTLGITERMLAYKMKTYGLAAKPGRRDGSGGAP